MAFSTETAQFCLKYRPQYCKKNRSRFHKKGNFGSAKAIAIKMKIELNYQNSVVTLPGAVIGRLENATEQDLKVLLYIASEEQIRADFDAAKLSSLLNLSEKEIEMSVAFWRGAGILKVQKRGKTPEAQRTEEKEGNKPEIHISPVTVRPGELPVYTGAEIEELMKERARLGQLLKDCQAILGKLFNVSESNKMIALSDYLHLTDDYILLLCSYCKSKDKGSVAYVATTAYELFNKDIVSYKALEDYIAEREKTQDLENYIRHLTGIGQRKLTTKEKRFIDNWASFSLSHDHEIIGYAYELSVDSTGELSFSHLNKILESWEKAGVKTAEDAQKNAEAHKEEMKKLYTRKEAPAKADGKPGDFKSFDTDDFFAAAKKKSKDAMKPKE